MRQLLRDECGLAGIIIAAIVGIIALLGITITATINWRAILAVFAAGIIAMAFAGFFFFHAKFEYVIISAIIALAIVFMVEVTFPVLIGGILILAAVWHLKLLSKKPLILLALISLGLVMMLTVKLSILGA